jgi:hypothetical protein
MQKYMVTEQKSQVIFSMHSIKMYNNLNLKIYCNIATVQFSLFLHERQSQAAPTFLLFYIYIYVCVCIYLLYLGVKGNQVHYYSHH